MKTSQTIYLTSTSKTIILKIENDKAALAETLYMCVCFSQRGLERKLQTEFFCSFAPLISVILNFYMDERKKIHINMNRRIIDDVRF